jgi:hypothetical protein
MSAVSYVHKTFSSVQHGEHGAELILTDQAAGRPGLLQELRQRPLTWLCWRFCRRLKCRPHRSRNASQRRFVLLHAPDQDFES